MKPDYAVAGDLIIRRPAGGKTLWDIEEVPKRGGRQHVTIASSRARAESHCIKLAAVTHARIWIETRGKKLVRVPQ